MLDRFLKEQGKELSKLTILDKLSLIGSNGRGALEYRPDNSFITDSHFRDFDKISSECKKILEERKIDVHSLEELYKNGGSSGGACPKVFAKIDGREWLVKFKSSFDPKDIGEIEYRYWHCRHCSTVYVISATDAELRKKIQEYQEFVDQYKDKEMPQEEMQKAQLILQTNVERSREIKEQHPLTLKPWER